MKLIRLLVILNLLQRGYLAPIVQDVPVCRETNVSLDLDIPCKDSACVSYKNILYQMSGKQDEFNYIYTADFQKIIVYSNNGRVYRAECETISAFDIISKQPCSDYVGVNFQYKFAQTLGYLAKQMIIRLSINIDPMCKFSSEQNNFANYNNEFSLFKKDDKVAISARNDSTIGIDFEKQNILIENYDQAFSSSQSKLIRDALLLLVLFLILVYTVYRAVHSKRSLISIIKSTKNVFKKCRRNKRTLLPTTAVEIGKIIDQKIFQSVNLPTAPSAPIQPPQFCYPHLFDSRIADVDPNVYHTIVHHTNALPAINQGAHMSRSTSSIYQPRMTTRSASLSDVKEEIYETTNDCKIQCPHCPKTFKNKRGLAGHMVVHM